jgi:hypothetical protein
MIYVWEGCLESVEEGGDGSSVISPKVILYNVKGGAVRFVGIMYKWQTSDTYLGPSHFSRWTSFP